jgi:hypothetical protein
MGIGDIGIPPGMFSDPFTYLAPCDHTGGLPGIPARHCAGRVFLPGYSSIVEAAVKLPPQLI